MGIFKIRQPNGKVFELIYPNGITFDEKKQLLETTVLDYWSWYIENKWFWGGAFDAYKRNHEDNVKYLLNRCSDFLLMGELNYEGLWIGAKKQRKIDALEIPISEASTRDSDKLYSEGNDSSEKYRHENYDEECDIYEKHVTYESKSKKVVKYKKEHRKNLKKIKKIQEIIDFSREYKSKWSIVDTDNFFEFDNKIFGIEPTVTNYQAKVQKDGSLFYPMDKILCYKQDGEYHFFDMAHNEVVDRWVQQDIK